MEESDVFEVYKENNGLYTVAYCDTDYVATIHSFSNNWNNHYEGQSFFLSGKTGVARKNIQAC